MKRRVVEKPDRYAIEFAQNTGRRAFVIWSFRPIWEPKVLQKELRKRGLVCTGAEQVLDCVFNEHYW